VRGTTSKKIVRMIRTRVRKKSTCGFPVRRPSRPVVYRVDTPSKKELIRRQQDDCRDPRFIVADSLAYLSLEGLRKLARTGTRPLTAPLATREATHQDRRGRILPAPPRRRRADLCEICESSCRFRQLSIPASKLPCDQSEGMLFSSADGAGFAAACG